MAKKVFKVRVGMPNLSVYDDDLQIWLREVVGYYAKQQTGSLEPELDVIVEVLEP